MYEAVLRQILTDATDPVPSRLIGAAVALRAVAPELEALSHPERQLLAEWLDRVVADLARDQG